MKKLFFQKSNSKLATLIIFFIVIGGFLFFGNAHAAHAFWGEGLVKGMLQIVLYFCSLLLSMANTILGWCIDTDNMQLLTNGQAIYKSWVLIRDLLNISFILVLLYTAFTIIFQVDSSNKKIILTVVLMALLVNFSFPITRFIIDISNTLMYTIVKTMGMAQGFASLTDSTSLHALVNPVNPTLETLFASVIFSFIFALTLVATGLLLIVRMIALAILIIFSPVAFVATILPGTKSYASKWWTNLFNYALFGPVMLLMIYITTQLMVGFSQFNTLKKFAIVGRDSVAGGNENFIGAMAYMSIPVVLLWIGMGTAQSMSIAGAGAIMGQAQKVGKWAGMKFSGARFATDTYKAYRARRDQAKEDSWSRKLGTFAGSQQDRLREKYLPGGKDAKLRYEKDIMSRIKKEEERADTKNMNESEARALIATGNKYQQAAGHNRLAELEVATGADLDAMRIAFGENGQATRQMTNKIRAYDPLSAFTNAAGTTDWANMEQFARSNQFDFKKIKNNSLGNAQFMGMLFDNDLVDNKKIEDIRNNANAGVLQTSLTALAASRMATTAQNRNIHMAAFAQTGNYTNTGNAAADNTFIEHLVSNMDKDNSKRTSIGFVNDARVQAHMSDSLRPNRVKQIIQNINNNVAQKGMLDYLRDDTRNVGSMGNPNASQLHHITNNDNDLQNIA